MDKFIYIPGFFDTGKNRRIKPCLDIWLEDIDLEDKIDSEYVIGHSLGGNFALLNWEKNKNTKLILTNPPLADKSLFSWLLSWIRYLLSRHEKFNRDRWPTLLHPVIILKRCRALLTADYGGILSGMPADAITVIRGKSDKILCDDRTADFIKARGIRVLEVENAGHDWDAVAETAKNCIK